MSTVVCEDHHICRNGSLCVPHPTFPGSYTCECSNDQDVYAGLSCDHVATSYCNPDNALNEKSFCTNNGVCIDDIDETGDHAGCVCPSGYKGEHCEFTINQSVPAALQSTSQRSSSSSSGGNKAIVATFSALAAFAFAAILVAAFVIIKKRRNGAVHSTLSPKSIRQADSTQLDHDGQVLRSSMRAITAGELYSTDSDNCNQNGRRKRETEVDNTDGVESGGSGDEDV